MYWNLFALIMSCLKSSVGSCALRIIWLSNLIYPTLNREKRSSLNKLSKRRLSGLSITNLITSWLTNPNFTKCEASIPAVDSLCLSLDQSKCPPECYCFTILNKTSLIYRCPITSAINLDPNSYELVNSDWNRKAYKIFSLPFIIEWLIRSSSSIWLITLNISVANLGI